MIRLYRCTRDKYSQDLSGQGAYLYGGRWNNKGTRILYTASHASLAMLELLVHLRPLLPKDDFTMVTLECDTNSIYEFPINKLPDKWYQHPAPGSCQLVGDKFVLENEYLILKLPSCIVQQEFNFLVNCNHPDFDKVKIVSTDKIKLDDRLF
jgi:RES domain-containing protein